MRILFAITVFLPSRIYGGPATVAMNQARELVKRGHEVSVVTSDVLAMHPKATRHSSGNGNGRCVCQVFSDLDCDA